MSTIIASDENVTITSHAPTDGEPHITKTFTVHDRELDIFDCLKQHLSHPTHFIQDTVIDRTTKTLTMPTLSPLSQVNKHIKEKHIVQLFEQLNDLHENAHVLHGDIKPDNIMYYDKYDELCFIDFDNSIMFGEATEPFLDERVVHSSSHRAPECLEAEDEYTDEPQHIVNVMVDIMGEEARERLTDEFDTCLFKYQSHVTRKSDVFALGVVILGNETLKSVMDEDLLDKMLIYDVSSRINSHELVPQDNISPPIGLNRLKCINDMKRALSEEADACEGISITSSRGSDDADDGKEPSTPNNRVSNMSPEEYLSYSRSMASSRLTYMMYMLDDIEERTKNMKSLVDGLREDITTKLLF